MTVRFRNNLNFFPDFVKEYFRAVADTNSINTRLGYLYDLKLFLSFLILKKDEYKDYKINDFTIEDMNKITSFDIDEFMDYISYYEKENENGIINEYHNEERGKSRKLAAVRGLLKFLYRRGKIQSNPGTLIDSPKIHDKTIIRLEPDEAARLLDEVESGEKLTKQQKKIHSYTKSRDLAIITLMLGTGIRVSECVGIDINHIDFNINGVKITRKGGDEAIIYFGNEVADALNEYLKDRIKVSALDGYENALFLSLQRKRISVRAVQKLVKKYSSVVTTIKNITPHKLRSTYGTALYRESGDIYLVADVLGHKDINTTKKHYAHMEEERRKLAAKIIKIRED